MKYWLVKTEPETFSWADLKARPQRTTNWEGVRNYKARNYMRDEMKLGDRVLFYHSVVKPQTIMGIAEIVREAYPDHFALDPKNPYHDPDAARRGNPWVMVDIRSVKDFDPPITLDEIKRTPGLEKMELIRKGSRLSVQPVTSQEWKIVLGLRGLKAV